MTAYTVSTPAGTAWDTFAATHPEAHILQTPAWGQLKEDFGWEYKLAALEDTNGSIIAGALLLFRALPFGLGKMAYIPKGPLAPANWWASPERMAPLWAAIHAAAKNNQARWLKVEAPGQEAPGKSAALKAAGFQPSPQGIQPVRTMLLDISPDEERVLKNMKQKTRYNIRLSAKKAVVVRQGTREDVASYSRIMTVTGERNEFGVHTTAYYQRAYDLFAPSGRAALFMASYDGRDLAGEMVFALGDTAWFFYGASSNEERQRMPAYALQWAAIQWAKAQGCTTYDLWGVPDYDPEALEAHFNERSDGLWRVYRFKRGFNGQIVRQMPAWDYIYNRPIYALYQAYLRLRQGGTPRAD